MAKKYLAFQNDLTQISNNDLVIKSAPSGTALSDLDQGTVIKIPETISLVETNIDYILVEKRNTGVTLLRKNVLDDKRGIDPSVNAYFENSELLSWLNNGFLTRFSDGIKNALVEDDLEVNIDESRGTKNIKTKVAIPSVYELVGEQYAPYLGNSMKWLGDSGDAAKASDASGSFKEYWVRDRFRNSTYWNIKYRTINSSGGVNNRSGDLYSTVNIRPTLFVAKDAIVDSNNILQAYGKTYSGTVEDIQYGNYYYKFKDIDGRISSNIAYDNTTSGMTATTVKGALDELKSDIPDDADALSYDNTTSGLESTSVQAAIDEIASSGGGITYDLTVAGTATGDCTTDTDWTGATWTANTSVSDMLTKIQAKGTIDINGALTKSWTSPTIGVSDVSYWHPQILWCEIIPAATFETLASSLGIQTDGTTDAIVVKAAGMGASGEYSEDFALIIGVLVDETTLIYPM